MRTKTLLVAAAAVLTAGVVTSEAQVYSQNIVGYVNTVLPVGNTAISNPLLTGTNGAEQVLTSLQAGDGLLVWNGAGYSGYTYLSAGSWLDQNGNLVGPPTLTQGAGFFYQNGQGVAETNTFVGTVLSTNTVNLPVGNTLVGSSIPYVAPADSTNFTLPLQAGDGLLLWTGSGYAGYTYLSPGTWLDQNGNVVTAPTIGVGSGFFYQNGQGVAETWTESLTTQ
jgi:hypothetical protein